MSNKLIKNSLLCLIAGLLLGTQPLQAASIASEDLSRLTARILLLEKEILEMKIQQLKIEALSQNVSNIEQGLKSLNTYIRQDAGQKNHGQVTIAADQKQIKKTNFFVPAGW